MCFRLSDILYWSRTVRALLQFSFQLHALLHYPFLFLTREEVRGGFLAVSWLAGRQHSRAVPVLLVLFLPFSEKQTELFSSLLLQSLALES